MASAAQQPELSERAHRYSAAVWVSATSLFAILMGLAVLVGWQFRISFLKNPLPMAHSSFMTPNAALCFILLGLSLWVQRKRIRGRLLWWFSKGCAAFVLLFGTLTVLEYAFGIDIGIDRIFFRHRLSDWTLAPPVGRYALITAVAFTLLGMALLLLDRPKQRLSEFFPLTVAFIAFVNILGYLYGARFLYAIGSTNNIAIHTASVFLALSIGLLLSRPDAGIASILVSDDVDGTLARRFLAAILILLPGLGWLRLQSERHSIIEPALGTALLVCISVVIFVTLTANSARLLRSENQRRQTAEQELRKSERQFRELAERLRQATDLVGLSPYTWDPQSGALQWDPGVKAMWGLPPDAVVNHEMFLAGIHPGDRAYVEERIARSLAPAGDGAYEAEYRVNRADGVQHWVSACGRTTFADGKPVIHLGVVLDITDRKRIEEEVRKNRDRLEMFIRYAPASLAMLDREMRYVRCSTRWLQDTGLGERDVLGKCHYDMFPLLPAHWKEAHRRGLAGETLRDEEEWVAADGKQHMIRWEIHPWGDSGVESGGIIIFMEDITERKRAEAKLKAEQDRLAGIISSAMDAIISVDENQRITVFNRAAEEIFRCPASRAIGRPLDDFIPARFRGAHREHISRFGNTGVTTRTMYRPGTLYGLRADGEEFPIEASISQVEIDEKKLFTVILRDITERKRAEEQRKQAEAALVNSEKLAAMGRLAATIAHEINNPLEAVTNALYLMGSDLALSTHSRHHLTMAERELMRVAHLTKKTLGFYRETTTPGKVSIPSLVEEVIEVYAPRFLRQGIKLNKCMPKQLSVTTVAGEIRQVISNVVANAIDAMPNGGTLHLRVGSCSARDGSVHIVIGDTGVGIEPALRHKIFDPLFTTKGKLGTGLGLWVTREILTRQAGTIRVRSRVKKGTVFTICLSDSAPGKKDPASLDRLHGIATSSSGG
jgi:PAS domain S-box-containing protein